MSLMEAEHPFLSVVIPTFNRIESLRLTLDGLARQDYPMAQFEVLVISDGSTDGTDAMLTEYAASAPYSLRLIQQANAGPARARNRGIREARGEVVVFTDDDVEPVPGFLSAHAAYHGEDERVAVCAPMSQDPARKWKEPVWIAWEHEMLARQYANWTNGVWAKPSAHHFYTGNASVRRSHLLATGGFDESFTRQEDVELANRMASERRVHYVFDAAAVGIHRPTRTFRSWLNVPYAYGGLDVVRMQKGDQTGWDRLWDGFYEHNPITRFLASVIMAWPFLGAPLRALLLAGAHVCYRLRLAGPAFAALSVINNLRYLEGARDEVGSGKALIRLVTPDPVPEAAPARALGQDA